MTFGYLLIAAILFSCILADRFSGKFGMPALILFMAVGIFRKEFLVILAIAIISAMFVKINRSTIDAVKINR